MLLLDMKCAAPKIIDKMAWLRRIYTLFKLAWQVFIFYPKALRTLADTVKKTLVHVPFDYEWQRPGGVSVHRALTMGCDRAWLLKSDFSNGLPGR